MSPHTHAVGRVDVGAAAEERVDGGDVAGLGSCEERACRGRGLGAQQRDDAVLLLAHRHIERRVARLRARDEGERGERDAGG